MSVGAVKLGVAGPSMVVSLPALLIVGAHVIGNVTFPTPRKSPGSGGVAHSVLAAVTQLTNATRKNKLDERDQRIFKPTYLFLLRQIRKMTSHTACASASIVWGNFARSAFGVRGVFAPLSGSGERYGQKRRGDSSHSK
jgi:hypothetical protein